MTLPLWLDADHALSFGPLTGDERVDVAIVGGGVTGLACARALALAGTSVRLVEARTAGSGASGRNGGFALRGTALPYDQMPLPDVMRFTEEALARVRELAGDAFRPVGSLRVANSEDELQELHAEAEAIAADGFAVELRDPRRAAGVRPRVRARAGSGIRRTGRSTRAVGSAAWPGWQPTRAPRSRRARA